MPKIWLLPVRCAIAVPNGRESGTSYRYSVLQWWKSHSSLYIHAKTPHPQREYIYGPARWLRGLDGGCSVGLCWEEHRVGTTLGHLDQGTLCVAACSVGVTERVQQQQIS